MTFKNLNCLFSFDLPKRFLCSSIIPDLFETTAVEIIKATRDQDASGIYKYLIKLNTKSLSALTNECEINGRINISGQKAAEAILSYLDLKYIKEIRKY